LNSAEINVTLYKIGNYCYLIIYLVTLYLQVTYMAKQKYITIPQLAKLLGLSRIEVYRKVRKGQIPAIRIGRNYAISDSDVAHILGEKMSSKNKRQVSLAVKRVVREYSEVLKRLSRE